MHPTQKPLNIIRRMIETSSKKGDTIMDAFMGSGTTAVACVQTDRHYIGFETDSGYLLKAEARIEAERSRVRTTTTLEGWL